MSFTFEGKMRSGRIEAKERKCGKAFRLNVNQLMERMRSQMTNDLTCNLKRKEKKNRIQIRMSEK